MTRIAELTALHGRNRPGLIGSMRLAALALAAFALAGCQTMSLIPGSGPAEPTPRAAEAIGSGSVNVALLLPVSASGNAGATARAMQNAAALALSEIPNADLRLVPFDTQGTASGAQAAAQRAVAQNARLIIGPLFAGEVRAAGAVAQSANIPIIAFSTDANVASQGVYLLSFLPEADIDRIVGYAVRNGNRSFAALLPEGSYGSVVEAAFQQAVARNNGRVVALERYGPSPDAMQAAVGRIAAIAGGDNPQVDAVLLPDAPEGMAQLAPMLTAANIRRERVQFLGSGQWNDEAAWRISGIDGGWFAAPDPSGWQNFQARYRERFGGPPSRNSTLAYDATSLAAALAGIHGADGFTHQILTNSDGFAGIDGVFRFHAGGTSQRGLSILEVQQGSVRVRDPAPASFGPGT